MRLSNGICFGHFLGQSPSSQTAALMECANVGAANDIFPLSTLVYGWLASAPDRFAYNGQVIRKLVSLLLFGCFGLVAQTAALFEVL